jgi:hypothetical protein
VAFLSSQQYDEAEINILAPGAKMSGKAEPQEDDGLFRPPWETDEDADLEPPSPARIRKVASEPNYSHPLLQPLAEAQELLTRLETRAEAASEAVAEGLRVRLSYREAAGWLAQAHVWIHPHDLALRDRGMTRSYGAAFRAGRLSSEIPATTALSGEFEEAPSDILVGQALHLARLWRRLGELATWRPLADGVAVRDTLQSLGCSSIDAGEIDDWMGFIGGLQGPLLLRSGRAARDWLNRPAHKKRSPAGMFLAACLWRGNGRARPVPLPFWSAPELYLNRLERRTGLQWMADFFACVAAASRTGLDELDRLQRAERRSQSLGGTARSHLKNAAEAVLRTAVITAAQLADSLGVSTQAARLLTAQLMEAEIIREATGRMAWRAYMLV